MSTMWYGLLAILCKCDVRFKWHFVRLKYIIVRFAPNSLFPDLDALNLLQINRKIMKP